MDLISCMQLKKEHLSLSISPQKPPNWKSKQENNNNNNNNTNKHKGLGEKKEKVQDVQELCNNYKGVAYEWE